MLKKEEKQLSFYSSLYEKIPESHLLKRIDKAVDFGFINKLVAESYCEDFGRPAKEPELMAKLLFLKTGDGSLSSFSRQGTVPCLFPGTVPCLFPF